MIDRQPEIFAHRAADTTDMGVPGSRRYVCWSRWSSQQCCGAV